MSFLPTKHEARFDWGAWPVMAFVVGFVVVVLATTVYELAIPGDGLQIP